MENAFSWYKATIKYQEVQEGDKVVTISEEYLFLAASYTDAETQAYEHLAGGRQDFNLHTVVKQKIAEVFDAEIGEDTWYKTKVQYIIFDEKTKKEKRTAVVFLVNSTSIPEAHKQLKEKLGTVEDYEITDINITKILEVIKPTVSSSEVPARPVGGENSQSPQ